jgi:antitoxin (DNA-binding transcriptional repressor) of toxin-antitoxin stability system
MKESTISVREATAHFADCLERVRSENTTLVLVEKGEAVARLIPENRRHCTGRDLVAALNRTSLSPEEAAAWHGDLRAARETLRPPEDKWQ